MKHIWSPWRIEYIQSKKSEECHEHLDIVRRSVEVLRREFNPGVFNLGGDPGSPG